MGFPRGLLPRHPWSGSHGDPTVAETAEALVQQPPAVTAEDVAYFVWREMDIVMTNSQIQLLTVYMNTPHDSSRINRPRRG